MQDAPTPEEILETVAKLMRETLMPELSGRSAYLVRVAANALDLARRQIQREGAPDAEELGRLRTLLRSDGSLPELTRELCEAIEGHRITPATPGLVEHLWATTLEKMAVDQPNYAAYKRAIHKN